MAVLFAVVISRIAGVVALIALLATLVAMRHLARRKPSTKPPLIKPPWVYWFWRIYVPVVYIGFLLTAATAILKQDERIFAWFALGFPLFAAAVMAILDRYAFPFAYSQFGKRRRTPLPDEPALRTIKYSYGIIGGVRATVPLVTWLLYRDGLGIKISIMGDVFLPWETIDALELQSGLMSTLYHHCPEVLGPIRMPNAMARIIAETWGSRYPRKVIVAAELVKPRNPFRFFQR